VKELKPDGMRREELAKALAWLVRRARDAGVDPLPILSSWRKDGINVAEWQEWTAERAGDVLRRSGLIPSRRKTGPKESKADRDESARLLYAFTLTLAQVRILHRNAPKRLKTAEELRRFVHPRALFARPWPAIVAAYRQSGRGAHALAGLVAAHVFGAPPAAALRRLKALRRAEATRTDSWREFVARYRSTLSAGLAPKGDADGPANDNRGRGNAETSTPDSPEPPEQRGLSRLRAPVLESNRVRRGGPPSVDRGAKASQHRRPWPRPGRVKRKPPP